MCVASLQAEHPKEFGDIEITPPRPPPCPESLIDMPRSCCFSIIIFLTRVGEKYLIDVQF